MSQQSPKLRGEYTGSEGSSLPSIYDTYLCREPAHDLPMLIRNGPDDYTASLRTLQRSADYFAENGHTRAVERLQLEMARLHMQYKQWERAARLLVPLWQTLSWRRAGWWQLLEETDWAVRECVRCLQDKETLIAVDWELLNKSLTPRQDYDYDFSKVLEGLQPSDSRPKAAVRAENILSCISVTFAFNAAEGNVGEKLSSQLRLCSQAHEASNPIVISSIKVVFEGELRNFHVEHSSAPSSEASTTHGCSNFQHVLQKAPQDTSFVASSPIAGQSTALVGTADLALAPGVTKFLSFDHIPREAGEVEVAGITLCVKEDDFDLEVIITQADQIQQDVIWIQNTTTPVQKRLQSGRSDLVKISPRPPRIQMEFDNLLPTYFTNEAISLDFLITNEEDDDTHVTVDAGILAPPGISPIMTWIPDGDNNGFKRASLTIEPLERTHGRVPSYRLGVIGRSGRRKQSLRIQATSEAAEYLLEIKADYHILSDPDTPVSKTFSANILIVRPFEASYNFQPLICSVPWPSYFDTGDSKEGSGIDESKQHTASGLIQRWSLTSRITSLADVPLIIDNIEPQLLEVHEAAVCGISPSAKNASSEVVLAPNDLEERTFVLEVQKLDLEDRGSTLMDLQIEIRWHREGSSGTSLVTHIAVPELIIAFGEPRVLASAQYGKVPAGVIHLDYIIENPSMYALTFNLTMETSEEFAFSGVKNVSVQLVPLSRHTVRYNLMPLVKGVWISPQFRVFDTHFQKTLKVNATEAMRTDKKGVSIWVDADG